MKFWIFVTSNTNDFTKRNVVHTYSDKLTENALKVPCYSIEEVLAEKIRSLIQ